MLFKQLDSKSPAVFRHLMRIMQIALRQSTLFASSTDVPVSCHQSAYAVEMSARWDDERNKWRADATSERDW